MAGPRIRFFIPLSFLAQTNRLLSLMASRPGRVFSRDRLLDCLHDEGQSASDRAIDTHIKNLRPSWPGSTRNGRSCCPSMGRVTSWKAERDSLLINADRPARLCQRRRLINREMGLTD
jgi:hypothetical protein